MNYPRGNAEAVEFPRLCCKSLFVHLRSPHMKKRDPVVADIAPSADTLTPYDNYPFSQHVSCIVGRVQHVESFHLSAKRRNETDSGLLLGHDGNRGAQGGSFLTVNLECLGQ